LGLVSEFAETYRDTWVFGSEADQEVDEWTRRHRRYREDVESPGQLVGGGRQQISDGIDVTHDLACRAHHRPSGGAEYHAASDPVKELYPQLPFQRSQRLRDGGLGDPERACRAPDALVLDDGEEVLDLT
jgi:hypothetical protein